MKHRAHHVSYPVFLRHLKGIAEDSKRKKVTLSEGCTNSGRQFAVATDHCFTVSPNICKSSSWNFLHCHPSGH